MSQSLCGTYIENSLKHSDESSLIGTMTHDQEWQRRIKMVLFGESKKKTGKHHFTWATTKSSRLHRLQACNHASHVLFFPQNTELDKQCETFFDTD